MPESENCTKWTEPSVDEVHKAKYSNWTVAKLKSDPGTDPTIKQLLQGHGDTDGVTLIVYRTRKEVVLRATSNSWLCKSDGSWHEFVSQTLLKPLS